MDGGSVNWARLFWREYFANFFRQGFVCPFICHEFLWEVYMKKVGLIIFAIALVVGLVVTNIFSFGRATNGLFSFSIDLGSVKGSRNVTTENRDLSGFNSVDVGGVFQVDITAQKDFAVDIEADDNLIPLITTEVDGGVLKIGTQRRISPSSPVRVHIFAPNIENLEVSGAANVDLNGIDNSDLSVDSSGASKIKIAGETTKLTVDVSGATRVDAEDLTAADAAVDASGASRVSVNVSGSLRTDASGASKIVYSGDPSSVEKKTSGASSVLRKSF